MGEFQVRESHGGATFSVVVSAGVAGGSRGRVQQAGKQASKQLVALRHRKRINQFSLGARTRKRAPNIAITNVGTHLSQPGRLSIASEPTSKSKNARQRGPELGAQTEQERLTGAEAGKRSRTANFKGSSGENRS